MQSKPIFIQKFKRKIKFRLPPITISTIMIINTKNRQTFVKKMDILKKKYKNEYFLFS